jgi:cGMP-dependent protein kinase
MPHKKKTLFGCCKNLMFLKRCFGAQRANLKDEIISLKESTYSSCDGKASWKSKEGSSVKKRLCMETRKEKRGAIAEGITSSPTCIRKSTLESKCKSTRKLISRAIERNVLFNDFDEVTLDLVIDSMKLLKVKAKDLIVTQGDPEAKTFFVINSGEAIILKNDINGWENIESETNFNYAYDPKSARVLKKICRGCAFGELALLYSCPRAATVLAKTDMELWTLDALVFKSIKHHLATTEEQKRLLLFSGIEIFAALNENQLKSISASSTREIFSAGETIIHAGEVGETFYVIESGEVSFISKERTVGKCSYGGYFGELALINDQPRAVTVRATTKTKCLVLTRKIFVQILGNLEEAHCFTACTSCPLLAPLTDPQLMDLASSMRIENVRKGKIVIREGDLGKAFYVIISGYFEVKKNGENMPLATLTRGDYFGELALLRNDRRSATVVSQSDDSRIAIMTRQAFEKKIGNLFDLRRAWFKNTLKNVAIFSNLHEDEYEALSLELTDITFEKEDTIIKQGERSDSMFILESGEVDIFREENSEKVHLTTLSPGSYFGELGLISESDVRTATAIASKKSTVLVISKRTFDKRFGSLQNVLKREAATKYFHDSSLPQISRAKLEDLTFIHTLGIGSFGKVSLVAHGNETYALKEIGKVHIVKRGLIKHVHQEKEVLANCDSLFIVKLYKTFVTEKSVYMLMDKVLGGDLFTYLQSRTKSLPESHAKFYSACVILAFEYLHSLNVMYRDLKPENLMLSQNGYLKLVDFSFAKFIKPGSKSYTVCGTPQYMSPEQLNQSGHSLAVDWWALGVLIFEMVNFNPPFFHEDECSMYRSIKDVCFHFLPRNSLELRFVVNGLLRKTPETRLGMGKSGCYGLKKTKWFKNLDWSLLQDQKAPAPYIPLVDDNRDVRQFLPVPVKNTHKEFNGVYASTGEFANF